MHFCFINLKNQISFTMKKITLFLIILSSGIIMRIYAQQCNDGLETNSFAGWQGQTGNTNTSNTQYPNWTGNSIISPNFGIVSIVNSNDSCAFTDIPLPAPFFGNYSAIIGQPLAAGCGAEQLSYSFTVSPADTNFLFTYAIVIQDAGHAILQQPVFNVKVLDQNANPIPNGSFTYIGGPNPPGFLPANPNCVSGQTTFYKKWTLRGLNLSPYINQTITLEVTNSDCGQCGHFCYGYVDLDCDGFLQVKYSGSGPVKLAASSEPNSQYLWETGDTTDTVTITNPILGDTISCQVTLQGGYSFVAHYILTPQTVNVNEPHQKDFISIYPNPSTNGKFYLDINQEVQYIEVYDLIGRKITTNATEFINTSSSTFAIDISNEPEGIYLVKVCTDTNLFVKKIVIE